eukprot:15456307-Alexandrium_andersonii.AAC.1
MCIRDRAHPGSSGEVWGTAAPQGGAGDCRKRKETQETAGSARRRRRLQEAWQRACANSSGALSPFSFPTA